MQLAAISQPPPRVGAAYVSQLSDWTRIFEPSINLVVHERRASAAQLQASERLASHAFTALQMVVEPEKTTSVHLAQLLFGEELIAQDIMELSEALCELVGAGAAGMRIAQMRAPMCPGFHVDRVLVRLVVAYVGPGSQWLREQHVNRSALAQRHRSGAQVVREGAVVAQVPTFHVALMKGELWPDNVGGGLVHRSPPESGDVRVVATFDPLD